MLTPHHLVLPLASLLLAATPAWAGACDCFADLNHDGLVEGADLGLLLAGWGAGEGDLNGNGMTDGADLGLLLAAWGPCLPPDNDLCGNLAIIASVPAATVVFCNIAATSSATTSIASCGDEGATPIHNDVWFSYSPPEGGVLQVTTCEGFTDVDTVVAVYGSIFDENCACAGGQISFASLLGCDDDAAGCGLASFVELPCVADKCYTIRVGGFNANEIGSGFLSVRNIIQGDRIDLCHPLPFTLGTQTILGTNDGDTSIDGDPTSCATGDTKDEWYCYTMPCQGTLTVSTCNPGTDFDTTLALFTPAGIELGCNDDIVGAGCSINGEFVASKIVTTGLGGEQILIRVSGFQGQVGTFELTIDPDCVG